MKPEQPIKQVLLLFSFFMWHLLSILLMGRGLSNKAHCAKEEQGNAVLVVRFTVKAIYPAVCTLPTILFNFKSGHAVQVAELI